MAMALNRQISAHRPQPSHRSERNENAGSRAGSVRPSSRRKKSRAFGSSTSQSASTTDRSAAQARARFTASVVSPVPPLPEATAIRRWGDGGGEFIGLEV